MVFLLSANFPLVELLLGQKFMFGLILDVRGKVDFVNGRSLKPNQSALESSKHKQNFSNN